MVKGNDKTPYPTSTTVPSPVRSLNPSVAAKKCPAVYRPLLSSDEDDDDAKKEPIKKRFHLTK